MDLRVLEKWDHARILLNFKNAGTWFLSREASSCILGESCFGYCDLRFSPRLTCVLCEISFDLGPGDICQVPLLP